MNKKTTSSATKSYLNAHGEFVIEQYNQSKAFSNFFPGIAGLWGTPMWVFYVNRGQAVSSFGIESKDKAIMEFQPANKAYRLTSLQGFRTFIKIKKGAKQFYWEPFQEGLQGNHFRKKQTMRMTSHDLTIEEENLDLGLKIKVNYFTIPQENFSGLVRRLTIENVGLHTYSLELIDGMPAMCSYGLNDWVNKHISRTVEAWVKVRNLKNRAPYYQLNVEVSDKPEVKHIKEGNFYFSFDPQKPGKILHVPIVESRCVFGELSDFVYPQRFLESKFSVPASQQTSNRTPSAFSFATCQLKAKSKYEMHSVLGFAHTQEQLNTIVGQVTRKGYIEEKHEENKKIVNEIKSYAFTKSASLEFDLYSGNTFLDNVLRGGLPVSLKTSDGFKSLNVYSRKHGDLERDYNFFTISPTAYSQGNGNFRDVNQNRRNDIWFNQHVQDSQIVNFFNLIQADGYNPLIVKGTTFKVEDDHILQPLLDRAFMKEDHEAIRKILKESFQPGTFLKWIMQNNITLKMDVRNFLGQLLEICHEQESADHGEGFWSDHWTYNLDLVESYLALFPEDLRSLLFERKEFSFYHNSHFVLPRDERYILTPKGVRQYHSVKDSEKETKAKEHGYKLRVHHGEGHVYQTTLLGKMLCLIANKIATLDPSGIGVEMEAEKPNWYDALNGLPGLLGSSISETFEIQRLAQFLLKSLETLDLNLDQECPIFSELFDFIHHLNQTLSSESNALAYWQKANDLKEHYRKQIRLGIDGSEKIIRVKDVKNFLQLVIEKTKLSSQLAKVEKGKLSTYFFHEVTDYQTLEEAKEGKAAHVRPLKFRKHTLPLFLEGYVHAFRSCANSQEALKIYQEVRNSELFDKALKMYKVNANLSTQTEEIGRTSIFPAGWLENESIWLHMEYKLMLELLRNGLISDFYENFKNVFIPFLKPSVYGRSILENSSFIVSSVHEDKNLHGQGFVARLSGSTAEFMHMWLYMNVGPKPFRMDPDGKLNLAFEPALKEWLFTKSKSTIEFGVPEQATKSITLPAHVYAFNFLGSILVVYHNPKRLDTFGAKAAKVKKIELTYIERQDSVTLETALIPHPYAEHVRSKKIERIDVYLG
jgi:hypothetical protein